MSLVSQVQSNHKGIYLYISLPVEKHMKSKKSKSKKRLD